MNTFTQNRELRPQLLESFLGTLQHPRCSVVEDCVVGVQVAVLKTIAIVVTNFGSMKYLHEKYPKKKYPHKKYPKKKYPHKKDPHKKYPHRK